MVHHAMRACLFEDELWCGTAVHVAAASIHAFAEIVEQVLQAACEATLDIRGGDVMSSVRDPLGDTLVGHGPVWQGEVDQFDAPGGGPQLAYQPQVAPASTFGR